MAAKPSSELSDEDSGLVKKKSLPAKKLKKKLKAKSAGKSISTKVKLNKDKKKEKKTSLSKEELAKYTDEALREVALKMKIGCDCPENCFKRNISKKES